MNEIAEARETKAANTAVATMRDKALVVDDDATNRLVLKSLLLPMGYEIVEAVNGAEAIRLFLQESPDIVFMDLMMPVLDGYEATRKIKKLCGKKFVPIIVLTALSDEEALSNCIAAGGDDVLTKPYDTLVLQSKIQSMTRIRNLHREMARMYSRLQREEEIAEQLFSGAVMSHNVALNKIGSVLKPAGTFSGDVLLTAFGPGRDLHLLLGDFTGHGLSAALGALPVSNAFRTMVAKGYAPAEVLANINTQMYTLMPVEIFLAAAYVHVTPELTHTTIYNFAMPEVLVVDGSTGRIRDQVYSQCSPLGIDPEIPKQQLGRRVTLRHDDRILVCTDGVVEAKDAAGNEFGDERWLVAVETGAEDSSLVRILRSLETFCGGVEQQDDISVVEIPCRPDLFPQWRSDQLGPFAKGRDEQDAEERTQQAVGGIEFSMTLQGGRLRDVDPVPLLMGQLKEVTGAGLDSQSLFIILTELYTNALDHGVLGLVSVDKDDEEGFESYFVQRTSRLAALKDGFISISIFVHSDQHGGRMTVRVEDSGPGFDYQQAAENELGDEGHHGRGISLINQLCESLSYEAPGNKVEAVYVW